MSDNVLYLNDPRRRRRAVKRQDQLRKQMGICGPEFPPLLPVEIHVFADLVRCRLNWIRDYVRPKDRQLQHRIFFGELVRVYAEAINSNPHAVITEMARKLANGNVPVRLYHLTDRAGYSERIAREHEGLIQARFNFLRFDRGLDTPAEGAWYDQEVKDLRDEAQSHVLEEFHNGGGLISSPQLRNLLDATGYCFKDKSATVIQKTLLDWVDESKVPVLSQLDLSQDDFTTLELLAFRRLGVIAGMPASKKSLRKRGNTEGNQFRLTPSYHAKISDFRNLLYKYSLLRDEKRFDNDLFLLPRKMKKMHPNLKAIVRFCAVQPVDAK